MERTPTLPDGICNVCAIQALSTLKFLDICKESSKQWSVITNYLYDLKPIVGKKGYYIIIDKSAEPRLVTDKHQAGDTEEEVIKRVKTRIHQKDYNTKRLEKQRALRDNGEIELKRKWTHFNCPDCETHFGSRTLLNRHLRESRKRSCRHCHAVVDFNQFKQHSRAHKIKVVSCDVCFEVFDKIKQLVAHSKVHAGGPHVCDHCKHTFSSMRALKCHTFTHITIKCSCDKVFINKTCYSNHKRLFHQKNKERTKIYKCPDCDARFKSIDDFNKHLFETGIVVCDKCYDSIPLVDYVKHLDGHTTKEFVCKECSEVFVDIKLFNIHAKAHYPDDYTCVYCKQRFKNEPALSIHTNKFHPNKYRCTRCDRIFINKKCFIRHSEKCDSRIRLNKNAYTCPICDIKFLSFYYLHLHLQESNMRVCWICKATLKLEELKPHLKIHNEPTHDCEVCPESYDSKYKLRAHEKIHASRPFVCVECHHTFGSSQALATHSAKHQINVCDCAKRFDNKKCYAYHIKSCKKYKVSTQEEFVCDYCKMTYKNKAAILMHIKLKHLNGMRHQCSTCGKRFSSRSHLKEHENKHNKVYKFICSLCGLRLSTKKGYSRHMLTHSGEKPHVCPYCKSAFITASQKTRHVMMRHARDVEFHQCTLCPRRKYAQRKNLTKHMHERHGVTPVEDKFN